jgi:predicted amino acid dehydrogenase
MPDKTPKHLEELKSLLNRLSSPTVVELTNEIKKIKESDIVVVTTSAREAIIKTEFLKHNSIVYDITQPRNIPEQVIKERKDVIFIEGGILKTKGINYHFNFGIPEETAFACLAEMILLACEKRFNTDFVGNVKSEKVLELLSLAERYNFQPLSKRLSV